jgi:hypothetical protein
MAPNKWREFHIDARIYRRKGDTLERWFWIKGAWGTVPAWERAEVIELDNLVRRSP